MSAPHAAPRRARTKIVATVGPASQAEARLAELAEAGVDVFRLNMAHGDLEQHTATVAAIRRVSQRLSRPIGILADLAGPKIRLGELPDGQLDCPAGAEFRFVRGRQASTAADLTSTYERLVDELDVGDRVLLADGTVGLVVEHRTETFARCRVTQPGLIRSRQGINLPGVKLSVTALSDVDQRAAVWAARIGVDFMSLSFVRTAADIQQLAALLHTHNSTARMIAKIEKPEALENLTAIVEAADGVMVARGDLGVEIDVASIAVVQKRIIATAHAFQRPVIVATQMLDSMQHAPRPTRAEVTDVANAILDGGDACMLSGETAIGDYPVAAVEMMNRIALATEEGLNDRPPPPKPQALAKGLFPTTAATVQGAGEIARQLQAKFIVVSTHSGATALALSKLRGWSPIVGVSDTEETLRQMCLYWGVSPLWGAPSDDTAALLAHLENWGKANGELATGDRIVLIAAGTRLAGAGHNMVMVYEVR